MQSSELYRQRANECVRIAGKVRPQERVELLKVAGAWLLLADLSNDDQEAPFTLH
jgi:hypothetical protein